MLHNERRRLAWVMLIVACAASARGDGGGPLRAYPDVMPADVSFDAVVKSQSLPLMKYVVNVIGAKVHPEEFHVTSSGQLMVPYTAEWSGLCVAALFAAHPDLGSAGVPTLALPPADNVKSRLVDGYMPAVINEWTVGDLRIRQLAFATCRGKFESITAREPLVALVRWSLTNKSSLPCEAELAVQFGALHRDLSCKAIPAPYSHRLSFQPPFLRDEDGTTVACLLAKGGEVSFKPIAAQQGDPSQSLIFNAKEENIAQPTFSVPVERQGDAIKVSQWWSPAGVDFYVESSRIHSSPMAVDVEVIGPGNAVKPLGSLSRTGFSAKERPIEDYIAPGQHSVAIRWSELAKALPQGASTLRVHCYYPVDGRRAPVGSWSPIVVLTRSGKTPRFKSPGPMSPDENRLTTRLKLAPGETKSIDLAVPYFALPEQAAPRLAGLSIDDQLAKFREYWRRELNRNAEFIVPESRIRDAYRACLASNFILIDRDPKTGLLMPHPDALGYEAVWAGDGSVSIQATDRMGYHREAAGMLDYFLARQGKEKPEGDVTSAEGFFSGDVDLKWMNQDGFVLWALAEHYKLTHDDAWLRRVAPQMVKGCDWIIRQRARTKGTANGKRPSNYGLLPKGRPSDLYIWDNWYWTDTYSYMGLRETADVLAAIGMNREAERLAAEAGDYKACIVAALDRSMNHKVKPPFVSPSPQLRGPPSVDFFNTNWYSISSPIYMVEAGLLDAKDEKVADLEYWLERYGLFSGLPAFGANSIDPYYVYNQSLSQLLRGEHAKFVWTLYSLSAYAMGQGTYATIEGQNIVTGFNSDVWSASRQPHMHSNSRLIDMLRIALLLEQGNTLHLMAGVPRGWLADGQQIEVRRAPSCFGEVNFVARSQLAEGKITVSIEPPKWQAANVVLHVRPPSRYGRIKQVSVNGLPSKDYDAESVRLPRLNKKTEVICTF